MSLILLHSSRAPDQIPTLVLLALGIAPLCLDACAQHIDLD